MVTTDALKLLYKKLGGTADVDNITAISDMVDLIEDVAGGGGGGASGLVVHETVDLEQMKVSLDKNYNEIKTALLNGSYVVIIKDGSEGEEDYYNINMIDSIFCETDFYCVTVHNDEFISDSATGELILDFNHNDDGGK